MMLSVDMAEGLKIIIIALLSYIPTVTLAGWFEAWVASKCDDQVPQDLGFLTLHPLAHFNVIGFSVLLIGQLFGNYITFFKDFPGWGRYIPLNPSALDTKKAALEFSARGIAHLVMMFTSFCMIMFFLKINSVSLDGTVSVNSFNSAFIQSIFSVIVFFYHQNFMLCVIYLVIALFRILLFKYFPAIHMFTPKNILLAFALLATIIIVGSTVLNYFLTSVMAQLSRMLLL